MCVEIPLTTLVQSCIRIGRSRCESGSILSKNPLNMTQSCHIIFSIAATLSLLLPATHTSAQFREPGSPGFGSPGRSNGQVNVSIFTDASRIEAMTTFHLVILFDIKDSWHLYWKNPGAGAAPIEIEVDGPANFIVETPLWPRPKIITSDVGDMYGYDGQIALFVPITTAEHFSVEAVLIRYDIAWAVCDDQRCLMQSKKGSITVAAAPQLRGNDDRAEQDRTIKRHKQRLPVSVETAEDVDAYIDGSTLTITGPARGFKTAKFLPNPTPGVQYGSADINISNDRFTLTTEIITQPRNFAGTKPVAGGLIALGEDQSDPSFEFSVPLGK